ncbi:conjugal transfer protein TrbH [Nitrosomonas sp. JL21]|nr:conjugal transfer protein TrbH [Nitrosomonas sp. JL21]
MTHKINQSYRLLVFLLVSMLLNGCATTQYGNFIQNPSLQASQSMAMDAAAQIDRLYPAASTQLILGHSVHDAFGQTLVEKLRVAGFAVQEVPEPTIEQSLFAVPQSPAEPQAGIRLSYIVDQMEHIYHANIQIGDRHLSRAFMAKDNDFHPAGHWVSRQ